ncbi:hypothetical protein TWF696_001993 [Orbilia brochopaga]|uniref:Trafficking protein particle complex subunit n=1 Tax=Orbilia brochopaga TaxID=3140254 RepID=A0AAV9U936_9PEZI
MPADWDIWAVSDWVTKPGEWRNEVMEEGPEELSTGSRKRERKKRRQARETGFKCSALLCSEPRPRCCRWYHIVAMVVYAVLILNKAGGLIFQRDFNPGLQKLTSNDYLILAGTFHGVHAITSQISPTNETGASGLEVLESENFVMRCFQTLTGTKFLVFAEPRQPNLDVVVRRVYELYSDYVMKNPFYQIEMPIRSEGFERHLSAYIKPHQ